MALEDMNKTAFRVPSAVGLFEYLVMTFGLKNAGATYQRAMMSYQVHIGRGTSGRHASGLGADSKVWAQNEPKEMRLWCIGRSVLRIPGARAGNRDRLEESRSCKDNETAYHEERFAEAHRQN